jgi:PleD family two-component response regulator
MGDNNCPLEKKIDVLEILLYLLREHEEKLDSLIEEMEIVDETINQDPKLKRTLHEYDATAIGEYESQNILVVDDDKSLVTTFKLILKGVGYHVDMAYTGQEALNKINQKNMT